jgi:hypothetical protein
VQPTVDLHPRVPTVLLLKHKKKKEEEDQLNSSISILLSSRGSSIIHSNRYCSLSLARGPSALQGLADDDCSSCCCRCCCLQLATLNNVFIHLIHIQSAYIMNMVYRGYVETDISLNVIDDVHITRTNKFYCDDANQLGL